MADLNSEHWNLAMNFYGPADDYSNPDTASDGALIVPAAASYELANESHALHVPRVATYSETLAVHESASKEHAWVKDGSVTAAGALNHLVIQASSGGLKCFFCGWKNCRHPIGFITKVRLIDHIRSTHLREKPFRCTTCGTSFGRKQEAVRHVNTMNRSHQYKCGVCLRGFSRKYYRDSHEEKCLPESVPSALYSEPLSTEHPLHTGISSDFTDSTAWSIIS